MAPRPAQPADQQVFAGVDPGLAFADPDRRAKLLAAFPAVDAAIEDERANQGVPGLAVGVVIDGELAYAKGFGVRDLASHAPPDADTVYRVGSVTKTFTALAIMALRDRGALALDDPLTRWVPEARKLVYATRDAPPITLRQLLTHSSGLPWQGAYDVTKAPTEQTIVASLAGLALENAPGTVLYSNLGFTLLGIVAGRAAHAPFRAVVAELILRPLGMTSTFWDHGEVPAGRLATTYDFDPAHPGPREPLRIGVADSSGGLYSTIRDLARYAAFELAAYPPRSAPDAGPIRRGTVREMHASGAQDQSALLPAVAPRPGDPLVTFTASMWGAGWGALQTCDFDDLVGKGGSIDGHQASLSLLPARGVAVIVLSNFNQTAPHAFVARILRELARTGALVKRIARPSPAFAPVLEKFLAVYDAWDDAIYRSMLAPDRPAVPEEKAEIASYRSLHGACSSYAPVSVVSPLQARFALACERGSFELELTLGPSGRINGFAGTSRGIAPPSPLRTAAEAITSLIGAWSDATYAKVLAKAGGTPAQVRARFADIGAAHGACNIHGFVRTGFDWRAELSCERGGALTLELAMDGDTVARHRFAAPPGCPRR